jgi:hypothetical protein
MKILTKPLTTKLLAVSIAAILIAVVAISITVQANKLSVTQCATKAHWEQSLDHYFRYGDIMNNGELKLLPVEVRDYYVNIANCIADIDGLGSVTGQDRQIELFGRLQMVESVFRRDGQVCAQLINGRICSD